jgi:hypothetical protein
LKKIDYDNIEELFKQLEEACKDPKFQQELIEKLKKENKDPYKRRILIFIAKKVFENSDFVRRVREKFYEKLAKMEGK